VHALNKWRETPLLTAANHGQAGAVDALLQAGADPCKCTDTGWSPLSIAAYKGHDEVVRLLLEEGAPTEEDDPTLSALLQAATKGLPDTVELLLRHGADHTVTTKKGDTALSILVEQNLIDAAVEMVTEYNANIPRCSRDRKKVQRARLLITLRMKQLEREAKGGSTDEEETDEEEEGPKRAQHEEDELTASAVATTAKSSKKRKKKKSKVSAENKSREAEEALLLELEQEETQMKKEKAEASNKREKKKERKAKEREQKMMEEQARMEHEEEENRERDRLRNEKEEKLRKVREKEEQERQMKEMKEREKVLAVKRKEREELEQREQKREERTNATAEQANKEAAASTNGANDRRAKPSRQRKAPAAAKNNGVSPKVGKSTSTASNRRWETTTAKAAKSPPGASTLHAANINLAPRPEPIPSLSQSQNSSDRQPKDDGVPNTVLPPRSAWNNEQSSFAAPPSASSAIQNQVDAARDAGMPSQLLGISVEHPAIALFRREKVGELISRCTQALAMTDDSLLKRVFYRWTVRAAHDPSPILDPIIPSWTESERIIAFFQRQLIAESRKGGAMSASMEALKEAGSLIAMYCQNLSSEVDQYRRQIEERLPEDWTDSALGMTVSDGTLDGTGAVVTLSWANRAQVFIPSTTFGTLRDRHVGPASRFLASCFMAKMWYDTRRLIVGGTTMDLRLSPRTKGCLSAVAGVSAELWSDPFTNENGTVFWGTLESVDSLFGGQKPFGKDQLGGEEVLAKHGGSLSVSLPMDATVATSYVRRMIDILKQTQGTNVPVSFLIFAHADCFHDLPNGPSHSDLHHLDRRLAAECQGFVQCVEVLPGGQHSFHRGDGVGELKLCNTSSLFIVLQNDPGRSHFEVTAASAATIISSMSLPSKLENPIVTPIGLTNDFRSTDLPLSSHSYFESLPPMSPDPQRAIRSDFGTIGGVPIPQPFSPANDSVSRGTRRGRLFDLVDNEEEDDVDLVSGMLNNLDVGLFQNSNVGSDVDIEAISLMGIGGPPSHSVQQGRSDQPRFS
jgi:hypothetical protein